MPINTGAFYRFAAYTSFVLTQNRIKNLGFVVRLSFIKGSTRNYLKPKRKTNKQMHDFVKVCLMPIDQLPWIASVSQTSGFRLLNNSTKFMCSGLVVSQTIQKQHKWLPGRVFSKFYFYLLFFNLQIWPANFDLQIWPANSTCRFNLLNLQPANCPICSNAGINKQM